MGMLNINTRGSFPVHDRTFGAMESGHAHAVAEAIRFLSEEVLPEAIERDHRLHDEGFKPRQGFDRPRIQSEKKDGFCCLSLARSGVCSCPDREQHYGR